MKCTSKSKAIVFFSMGLIIFLLLVSCGSDSNSSGDSPFDQNDHDNPDDTNATDFSGTYTIYDLRDGCMKLIGYDGYNIRIEQEGSQAQLYFNEYEYISCDVDDNQLSCEGSISSGEGWTADFDEYDLFYEGYNDLTGNAEWTFHFDSGDCTGSSQLTTTSPEVGSVVLYNESYTTFYTFNVTTCGSDSWDPAGLDPPLYPGYAYYWRGVDPGCYILQICEDEAAYQCWDPHETNVEEGETTRIIIGSGSAVLLSDTPGKGLLFHDSIQPLETDQEMNIIRNDSELFDSK